MDRQRSPDGSPSSFVIRASSFASPSRLHVAALCVILCVLPLCPATGRSVQRVEIWPAIDLRGGKCVRLRQGDYRQETVFGDDPAAMARHWVDLGAKCLHLVDLDGAREGRPVNLASVRSILKAVDLSCELGGGIRNEQTILPVVGPRP